jgi:hypothetical protein
MDEIYTTIREKLINLIERVLNIIKAAAIFETGDEIPSREHIKTIIDKINDFQIIAMASIMGRYRLVNRAPDKAELKESLDSMQADGLLNMISMVSGDISDSLNIATLCESTGKTCALGILNDDVKFEKFSNAFTESIGLYNKYHDFFRELMNVKLCDVTEIGAKTK